MASSPTEDEDIKAAIAMSLAPNEPEEEASRPVCGFMGLDRKAVEEERRARVAAKNKRERSVSPPPTSRKAPKLEETTTTFSSGAKLKMFATSIQHDQEERKTTVANDATSRMKNIGQSNAATHDNVQAQPESLPQGALKYPRGVVKKTWAFGQERDGSDIKLEEVLEPASVRTAVLSAYQWDVQWVLSKLKSPLNGGSTKCIFVMQAKEKEDRDKWREDASDMSSFLRLCFPPMAGLIWCMHSKLMLLFHSKKLRIAIPTANLLNFDWGETGQMENSVFIIDLPRLPNSAKTAVEDLTPFGRELMYFIEQQGLDDDVRVGVLNFDFSATEGMAFVHTVGGVRYRDDAARTGLFGLSQSMNELGLQTGDDLEIDFAASSIGQLNDNQLHNFYSAARGQDLRALAKDARSKAGAEFFKKKDKIEPVPINNVRDKLRIYFPTQETVCASIAGAAGTICLQRKYFESKTFPRSIFRDYKSTRKGILSHNKILCARSSKVAWLYVGSANMSKSAWGEPAAGGKEMKITCRNWECGVILPVPREALGKADSMNNPFEDVGREEKDLDENGDAETDSESECEHPPTEVRKLVSMSVFKGLIDLPFEIPGAEYDGREPWYFTE